MNSPFGDVFLFLTNLAWKSRITIPVLVTTVFLIMDIRLQIEINIQSGQVAAAELEQLEDSDDDVSDGDHSHLDEEYTSEGTNDEEDNDIFYCEIEHGPVVDDDDEDDDEEYENTANRLRRSLGLS